VKIANQHFFHILRFRPSPTFLFESSPLWFAAEENQFSPT